MRRHLNRDVDIEKEWSDAAEAWIDFVRTGKDVFRYGLNNPAAFELIGDVNGLTVLDLACGEGYNTRILARGGRKVTGVDFSEKLVELAMLEEAKEELGIHYVVLDATDLQGLSDRCFDLVVCFMALQDIEDYRKAISEVSRVLKSGRRFVFSIPHPCFETMMIDGERVHSSEKYFGETRYPIHWNMERLSKPFKTTSFHRTLTAYFEALHKSGFHVSRLVEPKLTSEALRKYPRLKDISRRPQSVITEAIKTGLRCPISNRQRTR